VFDSWVEKIPWRMKWQPTPVFLPRKSQGQRSLEGYGPWGHRRIGHEHIIKGRDQMKKKKILWIKMWYTYTMEYYSALKRMK